MDWKKILIGFLIITCIISIISMIYCCFIKNSDENFTMFQLNKMLDYNQAIGNCKYIPSENNYICVDGTRNQRY